MGQGINVNDNVNVVLQPNNNDNVNDVNKSRYEKGRQVDLIADKLSTMLHADSGSRGFLLKASWRLTEARVLLNAEQALKGKNPMGLFIYLCKRDGV